MKIKRSSSATLLLLLATLFWGMTFSLVKDAVATFDPFDFLFWRFGIASVLMYALFFKQIKINKKFLSQGILLGLFLGGSIILQTTALRYITASASSFITAFSVILVPIFVCITEKRWPNRNITIAVILAMTGIALITLSDNLKFDKGEFLTLLCAVAFAIQLILASRYSKNGNALTLNFIQLSTIFVLTGLLTAATGKLAIPNTTNVWTAILFCAVFASIVSFTLQLKFQQYVTASKTAIIFATEPIFATIMAVLYLDEPLTLRFAIGAGFVFLGILIAEDRAKDKVIPQD